MSNFYLKCKQYNYDCSKIKSVKPHIVSKPVEVKVLEDIQIRVVPEHDKCGSLHLLDPSNHQVNYSLKGSTELGE